jgi:signal transduction histidine kinase
MTSIPIERIEQQTNGTVAVPDFMELMRSFNEVTAQLERTHDALREEVASLKLDLEEANERLRRSRSLAALGEMAAGIAHEIRNPLGSMALNIGLIREDLVGQPQTLTLCEKISCAVTGLDAIVGDVLTFARDTQLAPLECDALQLVEVALAANSSLVEQGSIEVEIEIAPSCLACVDAGTVIQALTNIMRNACEALLSAGTHAPRIRVVVDRVNARCASDGARTEQDRFIVEDNGPGIPPELLDRVFNPFFTTRETGTGLGLAIVHRITDAHGGTLVLLDADPGTRVEMSFPTSQAPLEQQDAGVSLTGAVRDRIENHESTRRTT